MKQVRKKATPAGETFSEEERAAMKERAAELKAARRRSGDQDGESEVLAKIAELPESERAMAQRIHEIVKAAAPNLRPRLWYGMPGYARGDKNVCFFQSAGKFKTRYSTLGFNEAATLDEGAMWPVAYALTELNEDNEARIAALVKQAAV